MMVNNSSPTDPLENNNIEDAGISRLRQLKQFLFGTTTRIIVGLATFFTLLTGIYFIYGKYHSSAQTSRHFRILVPFQASKREYLDFIQSGKAEEPISKVSQDIRNTIIAATSHWFDEQGSEGNRLKGRVDFYFFPEGYDKDSYPLAFNKAIKIAADENYEVVGLIGNVSSTSTLEYGDSCSKEQLPMILPLATATDLMHSLRVKGVPAVLRLPPANYQQTKLISDFLRKEAVIKTETESRSALRTLVVKDVSNKVYSDDLVDGFRENYVRLPLKSFVELQKDHPNQEVPDDFGRILGVVPFGGEETNPFLYPNLNELQADALVIFGMTNASLETLAQARAAKMNYNYVILTDGAVDEYLLRRVESLVEPKQLEHIYLTFPLPCPMPTALNEIMDSKGYERTLEMTHGMYVADSVYVMLSLLDRGVVKDESGPLKSFISNEIKQWRNDALQNKNPKRIDVKFHGDRSYYIDEFGNATSFDYHLFRIALVKRSDAKDAKPLVRWIHAENECPVEKEKKNQINCEQDASVALLPNIEPTPIFKKSKK